MIGMPEPGPRPRPVSRMLDDDPGYSEEALRRLQESLRVLEEDGVALHHGALDRYLEDGREGSP